MLEMQEFAFGKSALAEKKIRLAEIKQQQNLTKI